MMMSVLLITDSDAAAVCFTITSTSDVVVACTEHKTGEMDRKIVNLSMFIIAVQHRGKRADNTALCEDST